MTATGLIMKSFALRLPWLTGGAASMDPKPNSPHGVDAAAPSFFPAWGMAVRCSTPRTLRGPAPQRAAWWAAAGRLPGQETEWRSRPVTLENNRPGQPRLGFEGQPGPRYRFLSRRLPLGRLGACRPGWEWTPPCRRS